MVGIVNILFFAFLPFYLQTRGVTVGYNSNHLTWRDYAINKVCGVFGPLMAAFLIETRVFGRRGTLAIGAFTTMLLQFGYTQISTPAQNLGISAAITATS